MLPGFRFLFAAIVLSMSILVFGLGAAALFRAAHEEFASNPTWRAAPEPVFAQPAETTRPVLAMLRVEPSATDPKVPENIPANVPANIPAVNPASAAPAEPAPQVSAPAEPATITSAPASTPADEPRQVAALTPDASSPPESSKPATAAAEPAATSEAAPAPAETPASETAAALPGPAEQTAVSAPAEATKVASSEVATPDEVVPPTAQAPVDQTSPPVSPEASLASTRIATLGGPPVTIETLPAKAAKVSSAKSEPDKSAIRKHREARKAAKHRRLAARARIAHQAPAAADPFAPGIVTPTRQR